MMESDTTLWGGTLHLGERHNIKERDTTLWVGSPYQGE